jgi:hypothetical protein
MPGSWNDQEFIPSGSNSETDGDSVQTPRRSERHKALLSSFIQSNLNIKVPASYKEAMSSNEKQQWQEAIDKEIKSLQDNETFDIETIQNQKKKISTKWVFSLKLDESDTKVHKFKARLVARGFTQIKGVDYQETFAPVVSRNSLRICNAICLEKNFKQKKFDVATAFLNGTMDHLCYIEQPEGTSFNLNKHQGLRLVIALYGTKQAARLWNQMLHDLLIRMKFSQNESEACLYKLDKRNLFFIIYVDEVSLYYKEEIYCRWFEDGLSTAFKLGEATMGNVFLGMHLVPLEDQIAIHQERYIVGMIKTYGQESSKPTYLPMAVGIDLESRENDEPIGDKPYSELIGSLLYAARSTRPEINFAVSALARYVSKPKAKHYRAAIKVLQYLATTRNCGIVFSKMKKRKITHVQNRSDTDIDLVTNLKLEAYVDADWATCKEDRVSQTGYIIMMMNGPVIWRSRKQKSVALSTMDAEYMALSDVIKEVVWVRSLLRSIGYKMNEATPIYEDNNACIELARDPKHRERSKHIDIRYHFIRDLISKGEVRIERCDTNLQLADGFTKALPIEKFNRLNNLSGIFSAPKDRGVSDGIPKVAGEAMDSGIDMGDSVE